MVVPPRLAHTYAHTIGWPVAYVVKICGTLRRCFFGAVVRGACSADGSSTRSIFCRPKPMSWYWSLPAWIIRLMCRVEQLSAVAAWSIVCHAGCRCCVFMRAMIVAV